MTCMCRFPLPIKRSLHVCSEGRAGGNMHSWCMGRAIRQSQLALGITLTCSCNSLQGSNLSGLVPLSSQVTVTPIMHAHLVVVYILSSWLPALLHVCGDCSREEYKPPNVYGIYLLGIGLAARPSPPFRVERRRVAIIVIVFFRKL